MKKKSLKKYRYISNIIPDKDLIVSLQRKTSGSCLAIEPLNEGAVW